jgi:cytochrome c oxidase assembly protein subunit 15
MIFVSLALVYTTLLLGVFVTSSHLGLSCPDWPLCPNNFSLPTDDHIFEYVHRLIGMITAIFLAITTFFSRRFSHVLARSMSFALLFIVIQIILGMFVVNTKLDPILVAIHLSNGVLVFAFTFITLRNSYAIANSVRTNRAKDDKSNA